MIQLGQAGQVTIKEGSIGSLLVSMPWNGNGFEVEIDELEMLLTPCAEHVSRTNDETSTSDQGRSINHESIKINHESGEDCIAVAIDIHEEGLDFGSSVEQFFECVDGLRSSQSALASSGILGWTCSVFNAITAASNLAPGSYYMSPEQKHIEASVRATLSSISVVFSFSDDNHHMSCYSKENRAKNAASCQYLVVDIQTLNFNFQMCPQDIKLDVTPEHMELSYLTDWKSNKDSGLYDSKCNTNKESHDIRQLQYAVEDALPLIATLGRPNFKK
ncbi:hypothetical protein QQ045_012896 [Rhodiola kirilowii]